MYLLQKGESATAAVFTAGRWDGRLLLLKWIQNTDFKTHAIELRENECEPTKHTPLEV
jgi:hypothetical protein